MTTDIGQRKADHLDLAVSGDVSFRDKTTLFEHLRLVHDALPDLHADEIDTTTDMFGKRLRSPIFIAAMTGGTPRAGQLNLELARIAEQRGIGFGLGSQRAMLLDGNKTATYRVRELAPTTVVLGNVGVVQARGMSTEEVAAMVRDVGADALCVHLNPAMEIVQPGGDRDFRGGTATLARLVKELSVPVVAKETGCGLSGSVGRRLREIGIAHVDVSGAGGTSWVAVETHRAEGDAKALGEAFWDWGIPTAASVGLVAACGFENVIATGGIASGVQIAKALVLGATACGIARPVLQALVEGGAPAAHRLLDRVEAELRATMLLVGAADLAALRGVPRIVTGELRDWLGTP